jgi:hypothetical protein
MKKHLFFLICLLVVTSFAPVLSQKSISNSSVTGVCYAGNKSNRIYVPPPDEFYKKAGSKGGASITVLYSGFTSQARAAVHYAVSILESILPADTKFTISASWEQITTSGVLGNSSITDYKEGWKIDAQKPLALYPIALAKKIGEESLNDSLVPDITLRINSSIEWYLGTDGNTPRLKYDLVTIVLHEVCHGIGFFDSMNSDSSIGWYGGGSIPWIYDTFIENFAGKRLTDTLAFKNYSPELLRELTGGNLYFNGPLLKTYTSGSRARIYAPSKWDSGSSISHLDETHTIEPNTLMTPFIDMGEAIHNPGNFTMSILGDLGWINTRIIHNESHDTENHLNELLLSVRIVSDTLYNHEKIGVVFSFDNFASNDTLFMTSPGSDDSFNCTVAVPSYNSELQYYFYTEDCFRRIYRSPSLPDSSRYKVYIGTDTVRPVITHTPLTALLEKIDTIKLKATVTDNLGIDTVFAEYRLNGGPSVFIGLTAGKENNYSAEINARSLLLSGGDSIQYRIVAVDSARVPNRSLLPVSGFFTIHIEGLSSTLESYSTDFSGEAANDFINKGFDISKPSGFTSYGLNSRHPYESPEDNDKTIEYTSILRHPLKFSESGILVNFMEVVLVEPGELGSIFGTEEFYDYVIVEGSKNFGKTWFSLADGYDSRLLTTWLTTYSNSLDGMNSTAVGKENMLNKHTIFYGPSANIDAGDTLLLRFRLFSDPYANGWGWVIEDLNINPLVDAIEKVNSDVSVKVYPNPGYGLIRICADSGGSQVGKLIRYSIFNISGISIKSDYLPGDMENVIDISNYPTGIYIIVLYRDNWIKTIKYSLIK